MAEKLPDVVERIARLVRSPSVSSAASEWDQSNAGVIHELANWLSDLGFSCELMPVREEPKKLNLIATLGRGHGGLVLAGHTDTVPYDLESWSSDPFKLRREGGRLYGLGTCDMKGFLAIACELAKGLSAEQLKRPLVILATADEESSMDGARALVAAGRSYGRHGVIGEPTDLVPIRAHKGILAERISVVGRAGHSSDPSLGNNAIDGMMRVLDALVAYRKELAKRVLHPAFAVSTPTMNFGRIHGGNAPNRIAANCELDFDLRVLPGMDIEQLRHEISVRVERALDDTGLTFTHTQLFHGAPAHELEKHAPIVQASEELTGAEASTVSFGTEAPYLAALGTDTIVLGPGSIDQAHKPDEYLEEAQIPKTLKILEGLVQRFCVATP